MIHMFSMPNKESGIGGYFIVYDVDSGSVHTVDELAFHVLHAMESGQLEGIKSIGKYVLEDIDEAVSEINALVDEGLLHFSSSDPKSDSIEYSQNHRPLIKALCLHIAHECNLRCRYCFAGQGEYHGVRDRMSVETGKKAIDFLVNNSGTRRNLEVDFFGGEPTVNFGVVKEIVRYAKAIETERNKRFRFTLTTNGLLLDDEMIAYANEHVDNVVLSLDGRKEVNDRMRMVAGNRQTGSYRSVYDIIVPRFQKLAMERKQQRYYIRGTYTRDNLDFMLDVLHIAGLGFTQISVEPVVAAQDKPYALREADIPFLCSQYEQLAQEMVRRHMEDSEVFNFFHFMLDLSGGPCAAKRVTGCGAGVEYLAVTPQGDLYPCHQFVGEPDFCLGNLDDGIFHQSVCDKFVNCHVYAKSECAGCWARHFCGGGCAANAYHANGDIMVPDAIGCALQKKRIECALYLHAGIK